MDIFSKVGVFLGGNSSEREISLMSGHKVMNALRSKGIDVHAIDLSENAGFFSLQIESFSSIFIALHGGYGEDGTIQGILEYLGVPYTGSGVMASAISLNKEMTKRIWLSYDLPTPRFIVFDASSHFLDKNLDKTSFYQQIFNIFGLPVIIKPVHEGSTIGITKVSNLFAMQSSFDLCTQYDSSILLEEFIDGREFTVPILGYGNFAYALPIVEICTPGQHYDYIHKYFNNKTQYFCPANLDNELAEYIRTLALKSFNVLNCRGCARVDLILRASDNQPFLLEINTSPGMTEHSLVPISAKAAGLSYIDLCYEILKMATLDSKVCTKTNNTF